MSLCEEYFPTKAYTNAVNRLGSLLSKERDRLDDLARTLGRKYAVSPDNLAEQVPGIVGFAKEYHRAYSLYLEAVLPQHKTGFNVVRLAETAAIITPCPWSPLSLSTSTRN